MATAATQWVRSIPTVVKCSSEEIEQKVNGNITQFQAGNVVDVGYCVNGQWFRLILNPHGHRWDCKFSPTGASMLAPSDKLRLFAQSENAVFQKIKSVFEQRKLQLPTTIANSYDDYYSTQPFQLVKDICQNCK